MKANHNSLLLPCFNKKTVSKSKITKKWKPITTGCLQHFFAPRLFQRAKLQKNESQSQRHLTPLKSLENCFKEQNYKKMKANHNSYGFVFFKIITVSKSKITKKWKPITTLFDLFACGIKLFQRAKLQKNESQSQLKVEFRN